MAKVCARCREEVCSDVTRRHCAFCILEWLMVRLNTRNICQEGRIKLALLGKRLGQGLKSV